MSRRAFTVTLTAFFCVGWVALARVGGPASPTTLYVIVRDQANRPIPRLQPTDFEILVDGRPIPVIVEDQNRFQFLVLFDFSTSMLGGFAINGEWSSDEAGRVTGSTLGGVTREWARRALRGLDVALRRGDTVRLGSFGARSIVTPPAGTLAELESLWPLILQGDGPSPIWDAVEHSIGILPGGEGRPIVILVTDGRATATVSGFDDLINTLARAPITVYTTGPYAAINHTLRDATLLDPRQALDTIADKTGGRLFVPEPSKTLGDVMIQVVEDLDKQYAFVTPSLLTDQNKVDIRVRRPSATATVRRSR